MHIVLIVWLLLLFKSIITELECLQGIASKMPTGMPCGLQGWDCLSLAGWTRLALRRRWPFSCSFSELQSARASQHADSYLGFVLSGFVWFCFVEFYLMLGFTQKIFFVKALVDPVRCREFITACSLSCMKCCPCRAAEWSLNTGELSSIWDMLWKRATSLQPHTIAFVLSKD